MEKIQADQIKALENELKLLKDNAEASRDAEVKVIVHEKLGTMRHRVRRQVMRYAILNFQHERLSMQHNDEQRLVQELLEPLQSSGRPKSAAF